MVLLAGGKHRSSIYGLRCSDQVASIQSSPLTPKRLMFKGVNQMTTCTVPLERHQIWTYYAQSLDLNVRTTYILHLINGRKDFQSSGLSRLNAI
eukprot:scaffold113503_cov19-Prasinocladus_malaysianus.AAC.2